MTRLLSANTRPGSRAVRSRAFALAAAVVVGLVIAVAVRGTPGSSRPELVWSDEFDGRAFSAPNPSIWGFATGGNGWGNQELECYTSSRANSALDGKGHLVITARSTPSGRCSDGSVRPYTSARLLTQHLRTVKYGRIRVRAKLPSAPGTWPAIWALGSNHDSVGWPRSGEIDISEKVGWQPTVVHGTLHGPGAGNAPYAVTGHTRESGTPGATYHVYGVDWTPHSVRFSVDGRVYNTITDTQVRSRGGRWVFDRPFYLLLDLAIGGTWPGAPTATTPFPQRMIVDYVRVYR